MRVGGRSIRIIRMNAHLGNDGTCPSFQASHILRWVVRGVAGIKVKVVVEGFDVMEQGAI